MKLTRLIESLLQIQAKQGDLDVLCTEGGISLDPENVALEEKHIVLIDGLGLLIGGDGCAS